MSPRESSLHQVTLKIRSPGANPPGPLSFLSAATRLSDVDDLDSDRPAHSRSDPDWSSSADFDRIGRFGLDRVGPIDRSVGPVRTVPIVQSADFSFPCRLP